MLVVLGGWGTYLLGGGEGVGWVKDCRRGGGGRCGGCGECVRFFGIVLYFVVVEDTVEDLSM